MGVSHKTSRETLPLAPPSERILRSSTEASTLPSHVAVSLEGER